MAISSCCTWALMRSSTLVAPAMAGACSTSGCASCPPATCQILCASLRLLLLLLCASLIRQVCSRTASSVLRAQIAGVAPQPQHTSSASAQAASRLTP